MAKPHRLRASAVRWRRAVVLASTVLMGVGVTPLRVAAAEEPPPAPAPPSAPPLPAEPPPSPAPIPPPPPPPPPSPVPAPPPPQAPAPPHPLKWDDRISFGIRAQYALPIGLAKSGPLSDVVQGVFLVGGEIGGLILPHLTVLGSFFYGFPTITGGQNSTCPNDGMTDCSANMIRFGLAAHWHFSPEKKLDPWVGLGVGYEILNVTSADDTTGEELGASSLHGFELSALAGAEYRPGGNFGLGPYVEMSAGHYASDVSATTLHSWVALGVRLRTGP